MYRILTLNLGATSTKMLLFGDEEMLRDITIRHTDEEISGNPTQNEQMMMRLLRIKEELSGNDIDIDDLDAIVVRITGDTYKMKKSGTYHINGELHDYLAASYNPDEPYRHAAAITLPLTDRLLEGRQTPVYLVDPITVDEFEDVARITGLPEIEHVSYFHALNQKATARRAASELGKDYSEVRLVVAHLGGGVSIGAHKYGRVIDSTNGGGGQDGPFSPNRCGKLPVGPFAKMCLSGKYSKEEIFAKVLMKGGFAAHTGLTDIRLVEEKANNGDEICRRILDAFVYQVCKEIGAQYSVLGFETDGFVLTGGLAYSKWIVGGILEKIGKLGKVFVFPGEDEGLAMASGALRVLRGEEKAITMEDLI